MLIFLFSGKFIHFYEEKSLVGLAPGFGNMMIITLLKVLKMADVIYGRPQIVFVESCPLTLHQSSSEKIDGNRIAD